jgi:hypothetical protein
MVIQNQKVDNKINIRRCNCSKYPKNNQNINLVSKDLLPSLNSIPQLSHNFLLCPVSSNCLLVYHQHIRGLQNKKDKLMSLFSSTFPYAL